MMRPYYCDERAGITIYHGRAEDVLPTLEPGSVDLVLTDPPYGIQLTTKTSDFRAMFAAAMVVGTPILPVG